MILGHWDVRGNGQPVRTLMHYLGLKFKEIRYPDEKSWFEGGKPKLQSDFPNLPYLIDEGKTLTETQAILIYLVIKAKRLDLVGTSILEEINFVQMRSFWADIRDKIYEIAMDRKNGDVINKFKEKVVPKLAMLEKHLNGKEFVCDKLTIMDFVIVEGLEWLELQGAGLLDGFSNLKALIKKVYSLPGVKEYVEKGDVPKYFLWESYANKEMKICY